RPTRFSRDWSSDVCSSELAEPGEDEAFPEPTEAEGDEAAAFEAEDEPEADVEVFADTEDEAADADDEDASVDALLDGIWTPATASGRASCRERGTASEGEH